MENRPKKTSASPFSAFNQKYPKVINLISEMEAFVLNEHNESWKPDIFKLSSQTIIEIFEDCGLAVPLYVSELTYSDYFGYNILAEKIRAQIVFEWNHNRKAFKTLRKRNLLEYTAGDKPYEANRICDSLPEVLRAKRSGTKVIMKLE